MIKRSDTHKTHQLDALNVLWIFEDLIYCEHATRHLNKCQRMRLWFSINFSLHQKVCFELLLLSIIIGVILFTNNVVLLIRYINRSMLTLPQSNAIIQHATTNYFA